MLTLKKAKLELAKRTAAVNIKINRAHVSLFWIDINILIPYLCFLLSRIQEEPDIRHALTPSWDPYLMVPLGYLER